MGDYSTPPEVIAAQLNRRRQAAARCARLSCGHRDLILCIKYHCHLSDTDDEPDWLPGESRWARNTRLLKRRWEQ